MISTAVGSHQGDKWAAPWARVGALLRAMRGPGPLPGPRPCLGPAHASAPPPCPRLGATPSAPLHLRHEARLEGAARAQLFGGLPTEKQVFVHEFEQHKPHQLAHVLATNELLVPARRAAGSPHARPRGGQVGHCDIPLPDPVRAYSRLCQVGLKVRKRSGALGLTLPYCGASVQAAAFLPGPRAQPTPSSHGRMVGAVLLDPHGAGSSGSEGWCLLGSWAPGVRLRGRSAPASSSLRARNPTGPVEHRERRKA